MQRNNNRRNKRRNRKPRNSRANSRHVVAMRNQMKGVIPMGTFALWPPRRIYAKLNWDYSISVAAITAYTEAQFGANNPNDPGLTLTATQPVWYDAVQAFYDQYRVWACSISVIANTADMNLIQMVIYPNKVSGGVTNFVDACAQPYAKRTLLGGSGTSRGVLKGMMQSSNILGTPIQFSNDFAGNANASPSVTWFWTFGYSTTQSTTTEFNIRLTQYIELYEKINQDLPTFTTKVRKAINYKREMVDKYKNFSNYMSLKKSEVSFEHIDF